MLATVYLVSTNILMGRVFRNSTLSLREAQHELPPSMTSPGLKLNLNTGYHIKVSDNTGNHKRTLCADAPTINRVVKFSMDGGEREACDGLEGFDSSKRPTSPVEVEVRKVTEFKTDFGMQSESHSEGSIQTEGHHMFDVKMC